MGIEMISDEDMCAQIISEFIPLSYRQHVKFFPIGLVNDLQYWKIKCENDFSYQFPDDLPEEYDYRLSYFHMTIGHNITPLIVEYLINDVHKFLHEMYFEMHDAPNNILSVFTPDKAYNLSSKLIYTHSGNFRGLYAAEDHIKIDLYTGSPILILNPNNNELHDKVVSLISNRFGSCYNLYLENPDYKNIYDLFTSIKRVQEEILADLPDSLQSLKMS